MTAILAAILVAILDFWCKEDIYDIDVYIIKIFEPKHIQTY